MLLKAPLNPGSSRAPRQARRSPESPIDQELRWTLNISAQLTIRTQHEVPTAYAIQIETEERGRGSGV